MLVRNHICWSHYTDSTPYRVSSWFLNLVLLSSYCREFCHGSVGYILDLMVISIEVEGRPLVVEVKEILQGANDTLYR